MEKRAWLILGLLVRLLLIAYGERHDARSPLKYTDIDYEVLSDGARFVLDSQSPYQRSTYRYTPLLAWLMVGNHLIVKWLGKLLFVGGDLLAGWFLFRLAPSSDAAVLGTWLLNPLVIAISTRGNAESVVVVAVLLTADLLLLQKSTYWAALAYALAVHLKIYPIIYAPSIVLHLTGGSLRVNKRAFIFSVVSASCFIAVSMAMYWMYGWEFLHETYLYHIGRRDHRHNFSVYHLFVYLSFDQPSSGAALALLSMVTQFSLLCVIAWVEAAENLMYACFLQTFVFVAYNRVCTSQYFLWYICLLPFVVAHKRICLRDALLMAFWWVVGQAVWLSQAYRLEMLGQDSFRQIWLAGIFFFLVNNWILYRIIRADRRR